MSPLLLLCSSGLLHNVHCTLSTQRLFWYVYEYLCLQVPCTTVSHTQVFDVEPGMQPTRGDTQQLTACSHHGLTMAKHTLRKHLRETQDQETAEFRSHSNPRFVHLKNACSCNGPVWRSQGQEEWEYWMALQAAADSALPTQPWLAVGKASCLETG